MATMIRNAAAEDFNHIYPLLEQLLPNKALDSDEMNKVFKGGILSETDMLLCYELDGQIIGFCAYAIINNLWKEGYISYIYTMVADEKYRGKGYGSQLIKEVIGMCKQQGMKRVELDSGFQRKKAHQRACQKKLISNKIPYKIPV